MKQESIPLQESLLQEINLGFVNYGSGDDEELNEDFLNEEVANKTGKFQDNIRFTTRRNQ